MSIRIFLNQLHRKCNLFIKGLVELKIDKSLIANKRIFARLTHKKHVALQDVDDSERDTNELSTDSEYVDTICNICNKDTHTVFHIWRHVLYAHGQIFIQIALGGIVSSVILTLERRNFTSDRLLLSLFL